MLLWAAINAIRSTGAQQLILAPGNGFTGGHSWNQTTGENDLPSSEFLGFIRDPLHNTAIDVHEVSRSVMSTSMLANVTVVPRYARPSSLSFCLNLITLYFTYKDIDFSGGHNVCSQPGPSNLAGFTSFLKQNNLKYFFSQIIFHHEPQSS